MASRLRPKPAVSHALLLITAAALGACGGGADGGTGIIQPPPPPPAPTVSSTSPASGATAVPVNTAITATFSRAMDPATLTTNTMTVNGVTGTVSYASNVATFTPLSSLAGGTTFTATVSTGARSADNVALASNHTWSFTTVTAPLGQLAFPLAVGSKWLYDDTTSGTACVAGCSTVTFTGRSVLVIDSQLTLTGQTASRVRQFRIGHNGDFQVRTMYLAQTATGLAKYGTGTSSWRNVLSTSSNSFASGAFLLAGGPVHAAPNVLSVSTATVPAGSFTTVRSAHDFTQTGQFAPEDIFETEREHFVDGVGLVFATQSYSFDDNDPQGIDQYAFTRYQLREGSTFTTPVLVSEVEANDSGVVALPALADSAVVSANVLMTDAGAVVAGTAVTADSLGVRRVHDWYRFVAPRTGTLMVRLVAERTNVDLDLYLLRTGAPDYTLSGSSTQPAGQDEAMSVAVTAGLTYYIGVQAWNTAGGGRTNYWLYVR